MIPPKFSHYESKKYHVVKFVNRPPWKRASRSYLVGTSTPIWSPNEQAMVSYPLLAGIPAQRAALERLADASLLRRRYFDQTYTCARCKSARVLAREVCLSCHSSHIEPRPLLHHYLCGHQAPQTAFETGDGYSCPKCRKELRHYGVDYDKPGVTWECRSCNTTMAEFTLHMSRTPDMRARRPGIFCPPCSISTACSRTGARLRITAVGVEFRLRVCGVAVRVAA